MDYMVLFGLFGIVNNIYARIVLGIIFLALIIYLILKLNKEP